MNRYYSMRPGGRSPQRARRGNSIILVVGLIVLLLIIAISFVTRAQDIRSTAAAYRDAMTYSGASDAIAEDIASEIANSLFVKPVDPQDENGLPLQGPVDEARRLIPSDDAVRYGVDPNFTWNFAPWSVVPWTNPPDWLTYPNRVGMQHELHYSSTVDGSPSAQQWDEPLMGLTADGRTILPPRQNPRGGPGSGDTRWLRDLEPQRQATSRALNPQTGFESQYADSFSHWRHLTNLSRPDNQWRIVRDIADVTGMRSGNANWDGEINVATRDNWNWGTPWTPSSLDGHHYHGGLVERLDVPVEQWPAQSPTLNNERMTGDEDPTSDVVDSGQVRFTNADDFWNRWMAWFDPRGYRLIMDEVHGQPGVLGTFDSGYNWPVGESLPPNFYRLSDLDGDGIDGEYYDPNLSDTKLGEKPGDEFRKGTARWHVSRVLTDTDGDGFTDSFWWLSPHMAPGGLKQVIGVSVTDNAGRINANVGTRFIRNEKDGSGHTQEGTRGWTPADLALMGQGTPPYEDPWNATGAATEAFLEPNGAPDLEFWSVGFFDNRANWSGVLSQDWLNFPDADYEEIYSINADREAYVGFNPESFAGSGSLQDLTSELGIDYNGTFPDGAIGEIHDRNNRLFYFQQAGVDPFDAGSFFTPMGIGEELELRSYEGNNLPWLYGRFEQVMNPEWSVSPYDNVVEPSFLRSGQDREETSPLGEQLSNRQLVADNRRKLTFFNSTRNETMPPWLWQENRMGRVSLADTIQRSRQYQAQPDPGLQDVDGDGITDDGHPRFVPYARDILSQLPPSFHADSSQWTPEGFILNNGISLNKGTWGDFHEHMQQKIDLREWERPLPDPVAFNQSALSSQQVGYQPRSFSQRLPMAIFMALTSGEMTDSWATRYNRALTLLNDGSPAFPDFQTVLDYANESSRESLHGAGVIESQVNSDLYAGDTNIEQARQTAAMLAANIQAWRDPDVDAPLYSMGWKNENNQPRGSIGAVSLPRLDGWALNADNTDPEFNNQYSRWRPAIEDQFIDGRRDDRRVDDNQFYDTAYQPFDVNGITGPCVNITPESEGCQDGLSLAECKALGPDYVWYARSPQVPVSCDQSGVCCQLDGLCAVTTLSNCVQQGGRWLPGDSCLDLDCDLIEPLESFSANLDSPYRGDDFDGPGYPLLWETTIDPTNPGSELANPYIVPGLLGSDPDAEVVAGIDNDGDNWPDTWTPAAINTRNHVRNVRAVGMEPQPFITEAFVTHVTRPTRVPNEGSPGHIEGGYLYKEVQDDAGQAVHRFFWDDDHPAWLILEGNRAGFPELEPNSDLVPDEFDGDYMPDPRPSDTIAVVQIANPYDQPIPLFDKVFLNGDPNTPVFLPRYKIRLFGQEFPLSPNINPLTEGRVSTLRGIRDAQNFDALDAGLMADPNSLGDYNDSIQVDTQHGMVLPPATHDRPYTLTIVSVPAARPDEFEDDLKRWTFDLGDGQRGELDMWLDYLDLLGEDPGQGSSLMPTSLFEFKGETYQVGGSDLVWLLRPAIDPEQDGFYDPTDSDGNEDWALSRNDDLRELWATSRLYYDGDKDSYYEFTGDEALAPAQSWIVDRDGDGEEDDGFLKPEVIGSSTYWSPGQAAVELVRAERLDSNGDLIYDDFGLTSIVNGYPTVFEYGNELFNPNTGNFSLLFDNPNGQGLPEQEIVIDRTLQLANDGTWDDPLLTTVTGLQWGKSYRRGGSGPSGLDPDDPDGQSQLDRDYLFPASLSRERLPTLISEDFNDWGKWDPTGDHPTEDGTPDSWILPGRDQTFRAVLWQQGNDGSPAATGLGRAWQELSGYDEEYDFNNDPDQNRQNNFPDWILTDNQTYMANKAKSARFAQWARYARPWGLDPEWPAVPGQVTPPQQQMEYAAPRYVLGRGNVTRSHSPRWMANHPGEQITRLPLVDHGYLARASPSHWTFDVTTGEAPDEGDEQAKFSSAFAEQRISPRDSVEIAQGITQLQVPLDDAKGNEFTIVIRGNDNSTAVNVAFNSLGTPDFTSKDVRESRGAGEASAAHYEYFEFDYNFTDFGEGGQQIDPDGVFDRSVGSFVDPFNGTNAAYFPWLSRNSRMPGVLGGNGEYTYVYRNRKPTAFDMVGYENYAGYDANNLWSFPDKGVYAVEEQPRFDDNFVFNGQASHYDIDGNGGYRYDENFLAPFAFQMNHKDGNFEQVGEVLNVWTHAHLISQPYLDNHYPGDPGAAARPDPSVPAETILTFSESLSRELDDTLRAARPLISQRLQLEIENSPPPGINVPDMRRWEYRDLMRDALRRVGRLEVSPGAYGRNQLVGEPVSDLASDTSNDFPEVFQDWVRPSTDLSHLEPNQPAGQRVLDLFVCDGPGIYDLVDNASYEICNWSPSPDGVIDPEGVYKEYTQFFLNQGVGYDPNFMNARGFSGQGTPGLININTASLETLRTLPHMYRMVHSGDDTAAPGTGGNVLDTDFNGATQANRNPRVAIPESLIQYRDMLGVTPSGLGTSSNPQPIRSAPYVGAKAAWLPPFYEPDIDLDDNGQIDPWEYAVCTGYDTGPNYSTRGAHTPAMNHDSVLRCDSANLNLRAMDRANAGESPEFNSIIFSDDGIATGSGIRGFQGLGELFQLETPPHFRVDDVSDLVGNWTAEESWEIDFAANRPFRSMVEFVDDPVNSPLQDNRFQFWDIGAPLSTDTSTITDSRGSGVQFLHGKRHTWKRNDLVGMQADSRYRERVLGGDMVAGDAEEANLLFSGISNMISTRSDMFTVHFRVRTFKPDPETGIWDATDPDAIVDDSRYVMLVDRSEVDRPGEKPKIIYLEKVEN